METTPPTKPLSERHSLLRDLIVESSLELLDRDGLGLGVDAITYSRVFDAIEKEDGIRVTRGSVHGRLWNSHDDYRNEVLVAVASHSSPHGGARTIHESIVEILGMVDELDLDQRGRVQAFCRIAGKALFKGYLESPQFRRFQAVKGVARGVPGGTATSLLQTMVSEMADGNQQARIEAFGLVFKALGLRARADLGLDDDRAVGIYLVLVQTLVTGAHLDHHAGFTAMTSEVETDLPSSRDWPWTYFGFGFMAGLELLFEPDPAAATGSFNYRAALNNSDLPSLQDDPPVPATSTDNRPRRTRQQLRDLLVTAGERLLLRDGIGLTPYSLTYASVFDHIKKTRGVTIHRSTVHNHIWSSQEEFQADILAEAARYHTGESLTTARQAMAAQTAIRNPDGSVNYRQMILDSTLAIVSAQMQVSASSSSFRRWQSIKASLLSENAVKHFPDLRQAVNDRYAELVSAFVETYRSVLPFVGLGVDPDLQMSDDQAYHLFAVIGAAFTSGADYNISAGAISATETVPLPRVDDSDRTDEWPIQALASLAVLDLLFVPQSGDPTDQPETET